MRSKYLLLSLGILALSTGILYAQNDKGKTEKKEWDVCNPPGPHDKISFTVEEGTWMNLDLSPDGQTIVFDLLGDIYTIPAAGGEAKCIRPGHDWSSQPRFSPDGSKILFTSDAGGGDNIWIMDADGSNAKQVTHEDFRLLNNAVWMPDGQYFVARKHFTSTRSLGAGEMWLYHISGGDGVQLTEKKNKQQDVNEPAVSPDGRYVYFSEDMYPGGYFQYNKDPNKQIYMIRRYDRQKGKVDNYITGPGGACRPQVSHSGKYLSFVRRVREKSVLFVFNTETGESWPVYNQLSKDQQEAWCIFGVYPGYSWSPDDAFIYIWAKGKIHKIWVNNPDVSMGGEAVADQIIPFKATCNMRIDKALKFRQEAAPEQFTARAINGLRTSPDGSYVVFSAVGHLWKKSLPEGKPERLTKDIWFESEPAFSPDGRYIVYVAWDDEQMGSIRELDTKTGRSRKLIAEKGIYRQPSYSYDGKKVVYRKTRGDMFLGNAFCQHPGIYILDQASGKSRRLRDDAGQPVFSQDDEWIYYLDGENKDGYFHKNFNKIAVNAGEEAVEHTLFTSKYANAFAPSPNGKWVAFRELYKIYVAAFPGTGKTFELNGKLGALPVASCTRDAGNDMHWSPDSRKLMWTLGDRYYTADLKDLFSFVKGAPDSLPPPDTVGIPINLILKSDKPEGVIAFTGATIVTMDKDNKVIENGTVVVRANKIAAIGGPDTPVPEGAKVMDVKGKTIMPGMVDVHAHLGHFREGILQQKHWPYYANLAYGVTCTHDPSANTEFVFSMSELVKHGDVTGPRIFSTGTILYGADGDFKAVVNNLDDAMSNVRRTAAFGAFSVKSYNQPRRDQRQEVIEAARRQHIMVYPEGGSFFYHNMTQLVDGHTGIEHNIPVAPLFDDVIQLWSHSQTGYTPTLIVSYGAVSGEYYWYDKTHVWEKKRLLTFTPRSVIDPRSRHRITIPDEEYHNGHLLASESCKKLSDAGVKVNLGAHGQLQGLGAHWELWMLQQGGMSNMQALRCATINGAEYIGMGDQLGSLEAGKLADLIILDKNPLEDIYNSESVHYTMVNGRLYDCNTMNETGNHVHKRSKFWWEVPGYNTNFEWHEETNSFMPAECVCGR